MGILADLENRDIDFPDPHTFVDPYSARSTVAGLTWFVTHSTRDFWQGKRNVRISMSQSTHDAAHYTYQDLECDDLHSAILEADRWGVTGRGKVGKLASWMRETPYGIEDESGEARAEWRATWAVLIINDVQGVYQGMDLLANTFYNSNGIADAVNAVCMQKHSTTIFRPEDLVEVKSDSPHDYKNNATSDRRKQLAGRDAIQTRRSDEKEQERSMEASHKWKDDDMKQKKRSCCLIM